MTLRSAGRVVAETCLPVSVGDAAVSRVGLSQRVCGIENHGVGI